MQLDTVEDGLNPLDRVEEILVNHNWVFNRMNEDELVVQVSGKNCEYRLFFIWQEEMNAMQFCCQYDLFIDNQSYEAAARALMSINENLWMGHFDIPKDTGVPSFRHACLFRGVTKSAGSEHIEDLVDVSMAQCERYYPVFYLLSGNTNPEEASLNLALMETRGES